MTDLHPVYSYFGTDAAKRWLASFRPDTGLALPAAIYSIPGTQKAWFSWDTGLGTLTQGDSILAIWDGSHGLNTIFQARQAQDSARALHSLVVWADWSTAPTTTVRGWTETGGVVALFQAPSNVVGIALSEQTIAFVGATGVNVGIGEYDTARLYWTPFSTTPAGINLHTGPDLTGQLMGSVGAISTGGDFVAVKRAAGDTVGDSGVVIAQLSSNKVWLLHPRAGMYMEPAGMSGTDLLAFEGAASLVQLHGDSVFQRWIRIDLSKLDALAAGPFSGN